MRHEQTTITPYRDGPLVVRGTFCLTDQDANEIKTGRDTVELCRCVKSPIRPFCDGTRRLIGFRAPSAREDGRRPRPGDARPLSR